HYNIIAIGSRGRPPMLATGRYAQWRSRFLRYIDTRPNGDALKKCILEGPYTLFTVVVLAVPVTKDSLAVPEHTTLETLQTMSLENKAHYESKKEVIHLILTRIGDEIYSTSDACKTAQEMWKSIERLQQGKSLNIQDVKTNLFWEFGKFTSHNGETMESYYTRFYKLINEMIRNNDNCYDASQCLISLTTSTRMVKDSDPKQAQRDKDMQKNLALIAKYFKKIYKPTNNNLKTSSNSRNKTMDTTPRYKNDNQSGQFRSQRMMNVARARENVDTDEENDEQELEAHYSYMAKIQEVPIADSGTYSEHLEQDDSDVTLDSPDMCEHDIQTDQNAKDERDALANLIDDSDVTLDSPDMCEHDIQTDQNAEDERDALANLIVNLKLDVDENKKIQKQLKKVNTSLAHELEQCKSILAKTSKTLEESNSVRDSCLVALQTKQTKFEKYKSCNDRTIDYDKLKRNLNETLGLLAQKYIYIKEGLKFKAYEISVVKEKHDELVKQSLLTKSHYEGLVKEKIKVIADLKQKEDRDIDKMISMEKQL
nr:hypothetical protein [Tanacetum cinerariifolium]